ncbi:MAG: class I fructose-bisphosphate aldolase [Anaerolineae bacterium]
MQKLVPDGRNIIILPLDHGEFQGPRKGLIDPLKTLQSLSGYDAVLLSPGMFGHCAPFFAGHREVLSIVRLNWNSDYCFQWGYRNGVHGRVLSPSAALAMGADAGLASLSVGTGDPATDSDSVTIFAELAEEAREAGLPLGGEFYPAGDPSDYGPDAFHDLVFRGVRILSELGASFVKTFYTGPRFHEVVEATPVPIIVLGASKEAEAAALHKAEEGIHAGARGVVFGRNVFESVRPQDFLHALGQVVREGVAADAVAGIHGF